MNLSGLAAKSAIWLDFREGQGSTVYDRSGNGNHGTIVGGIWKRGAKGWEVGFDGVDDIISIPNHASLDSPSFCVIFVAKFPALGERVRFAGRNAWPDGLQGFYIESDSNQDVLTFAIGDGISTNTLDLLDGIDITFDTKYHMFAFQYDASTTKMEICNDLNFHQSPAGMIYSPETVDLSIGATTPSAFGKLDLAMLAYLPFTLSTAQFPALYHHLMGV